jgi:lipopolysaccharide export system protein LptC
LYRRVLNLLALCVLVAAAAATWYWSRPREPMTAALGTADERPPSYYLKDADVLQTNDEGRLLYRIHAELVEEHPDDEALVLDGVLFEYREAEEIPWHVRAGRAIVRFESQIVELEQGVELIREPGQNGKGVVARTEQLVLEPLRHVARADGEVTFMVGASTLTAVGLEAFFKEDRLKLESNVRGYLRR